MPPECAGTGPSADPIVAEIVGRLEEQIGAHSYQRWFGRQTKLTVEGDRLTVGVASPFLLGWMQRQFRPVVTAAARDVLGLSARVVFAVDGQVAETSSDSQQPTASIKTERSATTKESSAPVRRQFADLAEFLAGPSNEFALTAAHQVCESPGGNFNPLFIHGGVGVGKTHLLEGIYRKVKRNFPTLKLVYLTAEAFANYFTEALRDHALPAFRQRFRGVDLLLVDDVDFLDAKKGIQAEFLYTFQHLSQRGKQIILTASRHPRLLTKLTDELTTRFLAGLVCRIDAPDVQTRRKIVKQKAGKLAAHFTPDALHYIAERFQRNVRELEGALNCLQTWAKLTGAKIGVTAARRVLSELERDCVRVMNLPEIEQTVCEFFSVRPEELRSQTRQRRVSQPRMLAMFLARKLTQSAYSEIGRYFGGRNHATVISAEKKVESLMSEGATLRLAAGEWSYSELVESLQQQLQAS